MTNNSGVLTSGTFRVRSMFPVFLQAAKISPAQLESNQYHESEQSAVHFEVEYHLCSVKFLSFSGKNCLPTWRIYDFFNIKPRLCAGRIIHDQNIHHFSIQGMKNFLKFPSYFLLLFDQLSKIVRRFRSANSLCTAGLRSVSMTMISGGCF